MAVGLDLDQYQLKSRVLLLFAPGPHDARYAQQRDFLAEGRGPLDELRAPGGRFRPPPARSRRHGDPALE